MSDAISKEQFIERFVERMVSRAGTKFDDGESIEDYARQTAPSYWEAGWQRETGPEECADADMSYWGED